MKLFKLFYLLFAVLFFISCREKSLNDEELLFEYIKMNDIENLNKLIKKDVNINCQIDNLTPLAKAALRGNLDIVKILIKHNAEINPKDIAITPLRGAVMSHNADIVKLLISKGADVNHKNKYGSSILMAAAKESNPQILKILLDNGAKASINDKDVDKYTAIFYLLRAIPQGSNECYSEKYKKKYDLDYLKSIKLLIEAGADLNAPGKYGEPPLLLAIALWQEKIMRVLIEAGADVNKVDMFNHSPLDEAILIEYKTGEKLLLKHGAKTGKEILKEKQTKKTEMNTKSNVR